MLKNCVSRHVRAYNKLCLTVSFIYLINNLLSRQNDTFIYQCMDMYLPTILNFL